MLTIHSPNAIEYYTVNGEVFFLKDRTAHPFDDLLCADADALRRDLERHPEALQAIERLISDPIEQLRQYAACRYGRLNETPDFVNGRSNDLETPRPGCELTCRFDCKLCHNLTAQYGNLTHAELEVARLVPDHSDKEIADKLHVSPNTVITHLAHVREKIGTHHRTGIMSWLISTNNLF